MRMSCVVVVVTRGWLLVIEVRGGKAEVLRNNDKLWAGETSLSADRAALRSNGMDVVWPQLHNAT
jgi:hypothetical protein